jgi:integrase
MPRHPKPWFFAQKDAWYAQVDGRKIRLAKGKKAKKEAQAELHRLLAAGRTPTAAEIRVDVLCDVFMDHVKADGLKPLTYETYQRRLKPFVAKFGPRAAGSLLPHEVETWSRSTGWGAATRHGGITAIKAAFSWARKVGHLPTDPLKDLAKPTMPRRQKILSREQSAVVLEEIRPPELRDLLIFLAETGARPGEGAALTAADVNLQAGLAVLAEHKTEGKTHRPRVIVLSTAAKDLVGRLIGEHPEGPLFRNARGRPWTRNAMACGFRRLRGKTALGREATSQAMRHRFATDAARQFPNTVVAALLGHKSTAMVDRVYSHIGDEFDALKAAVDQVRPDKAKPSSESDQK